MRPFLALSLVLSFSAASFAQDTLSEMPRYDRYEKLRREIGPSIKEGSASVTWAPDSKSAIYTRNGATWRLDLLTGKEAEFVPKSDEKGPIRPSRRAPERGRQFEVAFSPDDKRKAFHRDANLYVSDADGKNEVAITTDGSREKRIKYGIASWVYGEELGVREAMWWSPDGKKLAFYRFDETPVKDYYLQYDQTKFQDTLDVEAYPKAGTVNPIVTLSVMDLESKRLTTINTRFGEAALGEYVYDVRWSPDGKQLLYFRTNRKQNAMEFCAADPVLGGSRAIVREDQPQSWAENHPDVIFLADGNRFIWGSERNGYKNLYLYDLSGRLINPLTQNQADVARVIKVDEEHKVLFYTAATGNNPYLHQLQRVGLNGKGDKRLTNPTLHHRVNVSPDGRFFSDISENATTPLSTQILSIDGKFAKEIAKSDITKFKELGLKPAERFTFKAADGKTELYGELSFPSDFDPTRKYPVLVSVYGGPESGGGPENFSTPSPITELGFLVATFEGRGTNGRGKAFRDAVYGQLGVVEIDDQAAGVKALAKRAYVDPARVGIFGTSYGGYASLMALLRHPETFYAACSSSPVTDWRHYDTIYTERFAGLPDEKENKAGYDAGSAATYAKSLSGKLMLYYGTADNNVHPANTLQFIQALNRESKRYDLQVGPDRGHTSMNSNRMLEYFVTHLILHPRK